MKKIIISAVALTAIMGSVSTISADGINILDDMKISGELRPRYETVKVQDSKKDDANAFTARIRLAVQANLFGVENLKTKVGITTVNNFGVDHYAPASSDYEKVVDPSQAMLSWLIMI